MSRSITKTVAFKSPSKPKPINPDDWVAERPDPDVPEPRSGEVVPIPATPEAMKRFTIDVSESLHKRIKAQCAMRGLKMADVIREMLEKEFPGK